MRLSKPAKTVVAFGIGACLFVTTAFADMVLGSGYDKLKSATKYTTSQLEKGLNSYTMETSLGVTIDGEVFSYKNDVTKVDNLNKQRETESISKSYKENERKYYSYEDVSRRVWKNNDDNQLYVLEYSSENPYEGFYLTHDLFQEEGAAEVEKIIDAVVGNLKDLVQVEKNSEGAYTFNGSLSASQVPAVVNAVSSFAAKQIISEGSRNTEDVTLPKFKTDIYVTSVKGSAIENEQGLLTQLQGSIAFSGKDVDGKEHQIDVSLAFELKDIDHSVIGTPDLTNAIVQKDENQSIFNSKYEGTYVNNIVIQEGSKIIKIGERKLVIEKLSDKEIVGSFEEIVYKGYEDKYQSNVLTFTKVEQAGRDGIVDYVDSDGKEGKAIINQYSGGLDQLNFIYDIATHDSSSYSYESQNYYNENFIRVFE